LAHAVLTGAQVADASRAYRLPRDTAALFQPTADSCCPSAAWSRHAEAARALGAELHTGERVRGWKPLVTGSACGQTPPTYTAERLVLTVGAWATELIGPLLDGLAEPERQVLILAQDSPSGAVHPERFPVFNVLVPEGRFYGFPEFGVPGFKFGKYHHLSEQVDPNTVDRVANAADEAALRVFAERYFPDAAGETLDMQVCMFTNTPDEHFIVDIHPAYPRVEHRGPASRATASSSAASSAKSWPTWRSTARPATTSTCFAFAASPLRDSMSIDLLVGARRAPHQQEQRQVRRRPRQLYSLRPFKLQLRHGQSTLGEPTPRPGNRLGICPLSASTNSPRGNQIRKPRSGLHSMPGSASLSPMRVHFRRKGGQFRWNPLWSSRSGWTMCPSASRFLRVRFAMRRGSLPA